MEIRGEGSIQQLDRWYTDRKGCKKELPRSRCSHWRIFVETGSGSKSRRIKGSYSDAQKALKEFIDELSDIVPNEDTFASYAKTWAAWRASSGDISIGTQANDTRHIAALSRVIGDQRMDSITPEICRKAILDLRNGGAKSGKPLSGTYTGNLFVTLNAIMQTAENDGKIARNPLAKIKAPKPDTREKDALSPEELHACIDALGNLPLDGRTMAVYLMACQGLRRGEAVAVALEDISGGFITVDKAIKERDGSIGRPKSDAGVRKLPLMPIAAQKAHEWAEIRSGRGFGDAKTFCCSTYGGVLYPQNLERWWNKHRAEIGCAGMTMHQLRHSNLSMMARHMSPFDLQHWAGWSSIAPARVYIHNDDSALSEAVSKVGF